MNNGSLSKVKAGETGRRYSSSLREQQAEQTRERILSAVAGLLRDGEMEDLSYNLVAERAGVSVPTIYRYFPSRKDLLDGMDAWLARELKRPAFPRTFDELLERTPEFFRYYHGAQDLLKAAHLSGLLREANQAGRQERDRKMMGVFEAQTRGLPTERAAAVNAVFRMLYSFESYQMMHERYGVGPEQASAAVTWAVKALAAELRRDPEGPALKPESRLEPKNDPKTQPRRRR